MLYGLFSLLTNLHISLHRERGGPSALDMCIFLSDLEMSVFLHEPSALDTSIFRHRLFSVVVIQRYYGDEQVVGPSAIGICAYFDMSKDKV